VFKKRAEGFFYGVLVAAFLTFMEWEQQGKVGTFYLIGMCLLPFFGAWFFTSKFAKGFFKE